MIGGDTDSEIDGAAGWMDRSGHFFPWIVIGLVLAGAAVRIGIALASPIFTEHDPISLLRSDPALLYYVTERIVDNGGWPPDDFRADPRIEHPESTDIPAMFTVGQEFLVAWGYLLSGRSLPLHLFALYFMSIVASTAVIGIAGLGRELSGSRGWGSLAALLYVITPASYRTLGVILIREDLSLPLFALHLYLLARAIRVQTTGAIAAAALTAVAALATWHAMNFIFAIEVACGFAWFLRTGESPMRGRASWIVLAIFAAGGLLIPVLLSKLFVLSLPVQLLFVMAMMPLARARLGGGSLRRVTVGLLSVALVGLVCAGAKAWVAPNGEDYSHVLEMMLAKVRYLGTRPRDPLELSYGARLIWAGVFKTSSPEALMSWLGALALLTPVSALISLESWWHGKGDGRVATLAAFAGAALLLALMVQRLFALAAILSPPLAVTLLRSGLPPAARRQWIVALLLVQCVLTNSMIDKTKLEGWYNPALLRELAGTLHYVQDQLPDEAAIAADFIVSSAIVAQTSHPAVLQPKYETARSRDRIERFTNGLYHASPAGFREILRRDFDARYLLVDAPFLRRSRYAAGIPLDVAALPPGSAASRLLTNDRNLYGTVPGFRLLYQSRARAPRFRLYDLADPGEAGVPE